MMPVRNCTVEELRAGVEAMTTTGSAESTSSHSAWMCSTTGRRHVKRSVSYTEGSSSPAVSGEKVTVSVPDSTERVECEGRCTWKRLPSRGSSRLCPGRGRLHRSTSEQATSSATSPWSKNLRAMTQTALPKSVTSGSLVSRMTDFW